MYTTPESFVELNLHQLFYDWLKKLKIKYSRHIICDFDNFLLVFLLAETINPLISKWQATILNKMHKPLFDLKTVKFKANEELYTVREQMDAEDYLILKLLLTKDNKEVKQLLELSKILLAEDVLFNCIVSSIEIPEDKLLVNLHSLAKKWKLKTYNKRILNLFEIVNFITDFMNLPENVSLSRLRKILQIDSANIELLYILFQEALDKICPDKLLYFIDNLNLIKLPGGWYFEFLSCHLWYKTREFSKALAILERIDINMLKDFERIDYLNLKAKTYTACGQKGKAILIWQEIATDNYLSNGGYHLYFDTILETSAMHASSGNLTEAKKILTIIAQSFYLRFIIVLKGHQYYILRGDICLAENKRNKALKLYKTALKYAENSELSTKIKLIELDLWES